MKKLTIILLVASFAALVGLSTCNKTSATSSRVSVFLKDAPAHCDHIKLQISGIQIYVDSVGWITVPFNDSTVDILQFHDSSLFIGNLNIPIGTITQIKLMLGTQDSITISGSVFPLVLFAEDEGNLIIKVHERITPGHFNLVIDFNAAESIFDDEHGHFRLRASLSSICTRIGDDDHEGDHDGDGGHDH